MRWQLKNRCKRHVSTYVGDGACTESILFAKTMGVVEEMSGEKAVRAEDVGE